jgi:hypothetical protein
VAENRGTQDPYKAVQICVVGMKGSGKTELAYRLFDTYPFDRVAIDPNRDLKMPDDTVELDLPVPSRWPGEQVQRIQGEERRKRQTLYFSPDFYEPTYREDMDRIMGMAYNHGRACVLFDEVHEGAPANQTPPHMRRSLRQGRHRKQTLILATPRPMTVDPLVISNADWVYAFTLPNPDDRKRVAKNIGWAERDFDAAMAELGPFEYLRYEHKAGGGELVHLPPLPAEVLKHHNAS